ncbi:TRAP-type C4-dicarboxylate transport system, substrate-binding protein [Albimonas donghaensis]|uniref:TRAP-type C4-dicarboxylate transport system, substrate-binding protein n=1 Tax=Albimonas donghaensis TaxID=356660 RepID=A0A1H3BNS6_9RHOB|nr:TRAP transporter substrate-binding protein [Albimonas donghaensis]SDX43014.1 TRAP-type C4-dicarboxylate transport system, substrate-binding protein [Albimonas donghaensis]
MRIKTILAGATALLAAAGAAQALTVNVVGNLGITTQSKTLEAPFWNEKLPEISGGEITANFKPWNEMGLKGPEIYRLLGQGVMNVATGQLGHSAGDVPINDATDLAGLNPTIEEFKAVTEAFRPTLSKYYAEEMGLEILSLHSYQAQILYCRDEFSGLADLKGRKVRSSGASQADFIEYFGGQAVAMAFGEVQQGLQQGVIDCAITGTLGGYSAKWHEGAGYLYTLPINWGSGATMANKAWWDGLPEAQQTLMRTEISKLEAEMWALNAKENEIGIACNTAGPCPEGEPAGMVRVDPTPEDVELRRKAMLEAVLPGFKARCGEACTGMWNAEIGPVVGLTID